jgi:NADPH:quinone reductase-like Zn-dependent oxidoreductase
MPCRRPAATGPTSARTSVLELLSRGEITAQIAGRFPLSRAADALRFAEAGGATGKVVIVPDPEPAARA